MAKPDLDDGYLRIAHELFAALACGGFTKWEWVVIREVLDQVYGIEKRKTAIISPTQIARKVSTYRQSIDRATSSLVACNVLVKVGEMEYRFVKDYETWTDGKQPRLTQFEGRYCEYAKPALASIKPSNNGADTSTKYVNNNADTSTTPVNNGAYGCQQRRLQVSAPALTTDVPPLDPPYKALEKEELTTTPPTRPEEEDEVLIFGRKTMGDRFDDEFIGSKLTGWRAAKYPDTWIRDAILVANCNAAPGRTSGYITTCLRRWQARGGPDPAELVKAQAKTASCTTNMPPAPTAAELEGLAPNYDKHLAMLRAKGVIQ